MDRLACVNITALPLQIVFQEHPDWKGHPVVVVDHDKPLGRILWANEHAWQQRIIPGMRYATGLALNRELRAAPLRADKLTQTVETCAQTLRQFSPFVEPHRDESGIFWLDASGLDRLCASHDTWARRIRSSLFERGLRNSVVVGWSRFGTYALSKITPQTSVLAHPEDERHRAQRVPLNVLDLDPDLRDRLERLGITTVGNLLRMPVSGLRQRYGAVLEKLHRQARHDLWEPLQPTFEPEVLQRSVLLDEPETNTHRIFFWVKRSLDELIRIIQERHHHLTACHLRCAFRDHEPVRLSILPAEPNLDGQQWIDLFRLRFEQLEWAEGATELKLTVDTQPIAANQTALIFERPRRNTEGIDRALARIRAEFGDTAVCVAQLRDAHLPEAQFEWVPQHQFDFAGLQQAPPKDTFLIRRIFPQLLRISRRPDRDNGWQIQSRGPVIAMVGPYLINGGWWVREVRRAYYFAQLENEEWLWVFHDLVRHQWKLQGTVS